MRVRWARCARALGFRTIFNLCGPLSNPAEARAQVIGVLAPSKVLLVGRTLAALGAKRAFVVHGADGIDELTTTGESVVARVEESETGESKLRASRITPEMAGLPRAALEDFIGGDIETNAALLFDVLTGMKGARRDIVLLNAAAGLVAAGLATDLKVGVEMGAEAIDPGRQRRHLKSSGALGPGTLHRGRPPCRIPVVRLPKEFRFEGTEVGIRRNPETGAVILSETLPEPHRSFEQRFAFFDAIPEDAAEQDFRCLLESTHRNFCPQVLPSFSFKG